MTRLLLAMLLAMYPLAWTSVAQNPPAAASSANAPPNPIPLTLKQAEAIALRNNPQITIGKLRALQAAQYVREARSALLPDAYLSITGVGADEGSRIAAGALNNPIIFPRAASGATASQLITDFGRTTNLVWSSSFQAKAEDNNAAATTAQIILTVDQSFYGALETQALVKVAGETVNARQVFVDKVQALTNAKLKSDVDLSFAKVELARAKLLELGAENNHQAALASLSSILGYADQQNFQLVDESGPAPTPPPLDVSPLILQALRQRPEVLALENEVTAAEKFANSEHDLWRPTISATGTVGVAPIRNDKLSNWYGAAGVNVHIPVFNGSSYNARGKAADLQVEAQRQKISDVRNNIARDVRTAWQNENQAFQRLDVTRQLREQANLALDLAQARYNLGLGSIVEFTQAQLQMTEADIADTDARYQYRLSEIILAYTVAAEKHK